MPLTHARRPSNPKSAPQLIPAARHLPVPVPPAASPAPIRPPPPELQPDTAPPRPLPCMARLPPGVDPERSDLPGADPVRSSIPGVDPPRRLSGRLPVPDPARRRLPGADPAWSGRIHLPGHLPVPDPERGRLPGPPPRRALSVCLSNDSATAAALRQLPRSSSGPYLATSTQVCPPLLFPPCCAKPSTQSLT